MFFFISCVGDGKLILLSKNKTNNKASITKKKFINFFLNEVFVEKRLLLLNCIIFKCI